MSFEYSSEIVTTSNGAVDLEYYRLEASRLRNEKIASILASTYMFVKKVVTFKLSDHNGLTNSFLFARLAK